MLDGFKEFMLFESSSLAIHALCELMWEKFNKMVVDNVRNEKDEEGNYRQRLVKSSKQMKTEICQNEMWDVLDSKLRLVGNDIKADLLKAYLQMVIEGENNYTDLMGLLNTGRLGFIRFHQKNIDNYDAFDVKGPLMLNASSLGSCLDEIFPESRTLPFVNQWDKVQLHFYTHITNDLLSKLKEKQMGLQQYAMSGQLKINDFKMKDAYKLQYTMINGSNIASMIQTDNLQSEKLTECILNKFDDKPIEVINHINRKQDIGNNLVITSDFIQDIENLDHLMELYYKHVNIGGVL